MTTRAGTSYKTMEEVAEQLDSGNNRGRVGQQEELEAGRCDGTVGGRDGLATTVEKMIASLWEDRRLQEAKLAEERQLWEEEKRRRELEFEEERRRQQEEAARRDEQTFQQMRVLQALVEGVQLQGEAMKKRAESEKEVKVAKLSEQDDIVSYLTTFERLMTVFEVKRERWAFKLAPNLSGKAQKAYAALSVAEAGDYDRLREAILRRYDINEESYRQRFRTGKRGKDESNRELVARLNDLATKWLKSRKSREEVLDQIILEQFLKTLPDDVRVFVRERGPETSTDAAKLADDYLQARKEEQSNRDLSARGDKSGRRCHRCGRVGHLAKDCPAPPSQRSERVADHTTSGRSDRPKKDLKEVECYNCHKKGHYSSNCPRNALVCSERSVSGDEISGVRKQLLAMQPGVLREGLVEGRSVRDILLDTGCQRTLVHQSLVPESKLKEGNAVAIRCAHGDTVLYPLADITVEMDGQQLSVEAGVSETLPMSVLLGTDNPELVEMLQAGKRVREEEAFAVVTRNQAKRSQDEAVERQRQEKASGVQPHSLEDEFPGWMSKLDESLFERRDGKEKRQKTRKEKREERQRRGQLQVDLVTQDEEGAGEDEGGLEMAGTGLDGEGLVRHELDVSAQELQEWLIL